MDKFKYYPEDFGALTIKVLHMELQFDMFDDHTVVDSTLRFKALKNIQSLDLNAKNLEIINVNFLGQDCHYEYLLKKNILRIHFPKKLELNEDYELKTKTICRPSHHILEGLYYDVTPKGCPHQQITQCQQWGFQRIVPCIDDMTAKCTYSTAVIADKRYTNMISNGDIVVERTPVGTDREMVKYDNVVTPMATYLFFLGVGTYATFRREFEYPDGQTFMLELLVPPETKDWLAVKALEVLHDAIMWVYLFTGEDRYANHDRALLIKELVEKREELKKEGNAESLRVIREELDNLLHGHTWGYRYTGTVYREIGMQNSDFGGMENVGNTTITTNRIMPFPEMTDGSFEYMIRVKVHEFYHNLNGSEVTGRSPFEIWLNEAVTVFVENEYHEFVFGEDYSRLETVLTLISPTGGTFSEDENAAAMPIEPDGFNDPNELITGVTYVKAPEFVRMIETLMGKEKFVQGLALYHRRFKHSNASRAQWIECMEEVSGLDLKRMAQVWLKQAAYPKVFVKTHYDIDKKALSIALEQTGFNDGMHWEFPLVVALCDEEGVDLACETFIVNKPNQEFKFENISVKPAFISLNRGYSFYGKIFIDQDLETLYLQARKDSDLINRYLAFNHLFDHEMTAIVKQLAEGKDKNELDISEELSALYFEILNDEKLTEKVGAKMLVMFEQVEDANFKHYYQDLYDARKILRRGIARRYKEELRDLYKHFEQKKCFGSYVECESGAIKLRQLKNLCLNLLSELDTGDVHDLIKQQLVNSSSATDKVHAFSLYLDSSAKDKLAVLESFQDQSKGNLVSWENFLRVVGGNDSENYLEIIKKVENSESFRIEQANDQRALYANFAMNRKKSLLTPEGREFLKNKILQLAPINEYSTGYMLRVFGNIEQAPKKAQVELVKVLLEIKSKLDKDTLPSTYNTLVRMLEGAPNAIKAYEDKS